MKPKVSVIVTTYNRADFLFKRSLPSVLNQTYKDFECIVVDDCSTDGTGKVAKAFQAKYAQIKYIKLPQNSGVSAARNTGVQQAVGEYIAFVDDDDELLPNFLEVVVPVLKGLPLEFGGVTTDRIYVLGDGKKIYLSLDLSDSFYHAISVGWLLRKSVFSQLAYDEELRADTDADFGVRFFSLFKAKLVHRPLYLVYAHKRGESGLTLPSEQRITALDRFLEKNLPLFKSRGSRRDLEFIYRFAGVDYCLAGRMKKGISLLGRAVLTRPDARNALNFLAALLGQKIYGHYWGLERKFINFLMARFISPVNVKASLR